LIGPTTGKIEKFGISGTIDTSRIRPSGASSRGWVTEHGNGSALLTSPQACGYPLAAQYSMIPALQYSIDP
jgi:hypothetical protein